MSKTIERATCPHCGSTELGEVNTLIGIASCSSITREPGGETEIEYGGDTDVDWDSQSANGKFQCDTCAAEFPEDEIVWVSEDADADDHDDDDHDGDGDAGDAS